MLVGQEGVDGRPGSTTCTRMSRSLISAVAAASSSLPKEPPAWSIDAKALLHGVRHRYASPTFVAAHSHLFCGRDVAFWHGQDLGWHVGG